MPSNDKVIGRVAVKVLPDTSKFKKELEGKLKAVIREVNADNEGKRSRQIQVEAAFNEGDLRKKMLETIRAINAENKTMDSRKIRFQSTLSKEGNGRAVREAVRDMQARAKAGSKVRFSADLVAGEATLELDKESLRKVKHDLDHWRRQNDPVKLQVKPQYNSKSADVASTRLAILTRPRKVSIVPTIDKTALAKVGAVLAALSGARVLRDYGRSFKNFQKEIDRTAPKVALFATGILNLVGFLAAGTSNVLAFSAGIASIAPAALALPGILGGMAIGVGVTVAAFKDFNKIFPDVSGKLSAMQDLISKNFWAEAAKPIRNMIDVLLPQLSAGFGQTATALGGFFGGLGAELTGTLSGELASMFKDLADSIRIATTGTDAFANIIKVLGATGAGYLPRLAQWFVDISTKFSNFLTKAQADDSLTGWIDTGVLALKDLGRVIGNLGKVFYSLGTAAEKAGGSTIAMVADTLERVSKAVASIGFQTAFIGVLNAAHTAMSNIADGAGPAVLNAFKNIADFLTSALPFAGQAAGVALKGIANVLADPRLNQGFQRMIIDLRDGLKGLEPAFSQLGPPIGVLLELIGKLVEGFGPLLGAAISAVIPLIMNLEGPLGSLYLLLAQGLTVAIEALVPIITVLADVLGNAFLIAVQALTPYVQQLAEGFASLGTSGVLDALITAVTTMTPLFAQLGESLSIVGEVLVTNIAAILPVLAEGFSVVTAALLPLAATVVNFVLAVLPPLVNFIGQLITEYLPPLAEAFAGLVQAITPVIAVILAVVRVALPPLLAVLKFLVGFLLDTVVMAIHGVTNVINGAVKIITGIVNLFADFFTGKWGNLWDDVKQILSGALDLIIGAIQLAFSVGVLGAVRRGFLAMKAAFELGGKVVLDLVVGLAKGLVDLFVNLFTLIKSSPTEALTAIKLAFRELWSTVKTVTSTALGELKSLITTLAKDAIQYVVDLPQTIKRDLGDLGSVLLDAGRAIMGGLLKGIKDKFKDVTGFLDHITSILPFHKGPPAKDRALLKPAGMMVMGGFLKGLESGYDTVRKSLHGFTREIGGMDFAIPGASIAGASMRGANIDGAMSSGGGGASRTLNYYAAPGNSLNSEEDLFAAANRGRMVGW